MGLESKMTLSRKGAVRHSRLERSQHWPTTSSQRLVYSEVSTRPEDLEANIKHEDPSSSNNSVDSTYHGHSAIYNAENNPFLSTDRRTAKQARLPHNLSGRNLWLLVACLFVALLLSTLEQLIIGVALTSISTDLGEFQKSSWIVTSYLMAYNSFLMVFARASDIFGRRSTFMFALVAFTVASLGCGLANTMTQLIVFRAFQGVGGAGLYIITLTVATEIPGKARTVINILIPMGFGIAAGVAPVIGGAIVSNTTWRWIFLLNVPGGVVVAIVTFFVFPKNVVKLYFHWADFLRIDWIGLILLVGAVQMLSFALHEADGAQGWNNSKTIGTAAGQFVCWIVLFTWEWYITKNEERLQIFPLWPTRLWKGRVMIFAMLASFFSGFPLYAVYIYLPQRYELVDGFSPFKAGLVFLPTPVAIFTATGIAAALSLRKNISHKIFVGGAALQLLGLGLVSTVGVGGLESVPPRFYVYGIITGFGIGSCLPTINLITRAESGIKDHSVNSAAVSSLRTIGGTVATGILQTVISGNLLTSLTNSPEVTSTISPAEIANLSQNPSNLSAFTAPQQALVRMFIGQAFQQGWRVIAGIAGATLICGLLCLVRHPVDLKEIDRQEIAERERLDELAAEAALIEKRRGESRRAIREHDSSRFISRANMRQPGRILKEKGLTHLYDRLHHHKNSTDETETRTSSDGLFENEKNGFSQPTRLYGGLTIGDRSSYAFKENSDLARLYAAVDSSQDTWQKGQAGGNGVGFSKLYVTLDSELSSRWTLDTLSSIRSVGDHQRLWDEEDDDDDDDDAASFV